MTDASIRLLASEYHAGSGWPQSFLVYQPRYFELPGEPETALQQIPAPRPLGVCVQAASSAALKAAVDVAHKLGKDGEPAKVMLCDIKSAQARVFRTYGEDSYPPTIKTAATA